MVVPKRCLKNFLIRVANIAIHPRRRSIFLNESWEPTFYAIANSYKAL